MFASSKEAKHPLTEDPVISICHAYTVLDTWEECSKQFCILISTGKTNKNPKFIAPKIK